MEGRAGVVVRLMILELVEVGLMDTMVAMICT